ncbi:MAG: hypothetical protein ABS79_00315 [Planctomycetes bacterium SCN 63-9]|nr:MAG: hypothetical protein ABS79_00315 [Planctomycetes bacterium SCN 63-9]
MIADATTDSLDESDEHACLASMLQEEVVCPFPAKIDGEVVECLGFQGLRCGYRMNAICRSKKGKTIVVDFTKLELIDPRPRGAEWLEAYAAWQSMQDH